MTTYRLRYRVVGTGEAGWSDPITVTDTQHHLTGLAPGVRYDVEVTAISGGLESLATVGQRSTVCDAPSLPTVLPTGFALSSSDPGTNGGLAASWGAVTGAVSYEVRRRSTGVGSYVAVGDRVATTSLAMSGLDGAASYDVQVVAVNVDGDVSDPSAARTAVPARVAAGGTVTSFEGNGAIGEIGTTYVVHSFTAAGSSSFTLNRAMVVSHLVVAGGGGGGYAYDGGPGGGGGAGGLVAGARTLGQGTIAVAVGAGGAAGVGGAGGQGQDSSAGALTAAGGGAGGASRANGGDGGSGGGGGGRHISPAGIGGLALGQGNAGATSPGGTGAGGGGGAGGSPTQPSTTAAGPGGVGLDSTITGATVRYATGGAGGSRESRSNGSSGTAGRGDGGAGGSHHTGDPVTGGAGGSGVVVLRYALPVDATPAVPSGVTAIAAGHAAGATTGAASVAWDPIDGATFALRHRQITPSVGSWSSEDVGSVTSRLVESLDPTRDYEFSVTATVGGVSSSPSQPVTSRASIATGGTVVAFTSSGATDGIITNEAATYVVHTFTSTASRQVFVMNREIDLQYLIVAGGGAGGSRHGGGGGAGGLRTGSSSAGSGVLATPGSDLHPTGYAVVVGAGGVGAAQHLLGAANTPSPTSGASSSALGLSVTGGGAGGGTAFLSGQSGGSGGGATNGDTGVMGGAVAVVGQGSAGGSGRTNPWLGGGGGGAGGAGGNATTSNAGAGGAGWDSVIAGDSVTSYAGGGGGSTNSGTRGLGGSGVGGDGAQGGFVGGDGSPNTGSGGGGGGFSDSTNYSGGGGGSGVVILRYRLPS